MKSGDEDAHSPDAARLAAVLRAIGDAFYVLDKDRRFLFASQAALDLWGKHASDVMGREFLACFPQAAGSEVFETQVRVLGSGIPEHLETVSPILGYWIEVDLAPTDEGGVWVVLRDVQARKAAQDVVRESEERLRSAVEVGKLGLWDMDVQTGASHWSPRYYEMQGYKVGEVAPSYDAWLARIHPEDRAAAEAAVTHARITGEDYVNEYRTVYPDGSIHWRAARGRFFYDDAGQASRMIGAATDMTERREWEERQKTLVAELQHRTRNLLAVVQAMAELTVRTSTDLADFSTRFRYRISALARAQDLLARLDEGERVTFDDLVRTELTALHGDASRVRIEGPSGIRLRSSSVQTLALALHELGTNAVKYGALAQPTGLLEVTWHLQRDHERGDEAQTWLHVDWRESGVKMPLPGSAPSGGGQGRRLIETALPRQLNATTTYTLGADGVHCTIAIPLSVPAGR